MTDAREVITAAIPCNIVYGRQQAADGIIRALTAAGYSIIPPGGMHEPTLERAAREVECGCLTIDGAGAKHCSYPDNCAMEDAAAIRSLGEVR